MPNGSASGYPVRAQWSPDLWLQIEENGAVRCGYAGLPPEIERRMVLALRYRGAGQGDRGETNRGAGPIIAEGDGGDRPVCTPEPIDEVRT